MTGSTSDVLKLADLDIQGKTLLIRQDLNVPMDNGSISNDARIQAALPTLKLALSRGARVILASHLGRPKEGNFDAAFSLAPIADHLSKLLGQKVPLVGAWEKDFKPSTPICLLENVRFNPGEKANDKGLAKKMAQLCDIFVMDAFGTAHRAQASTEGVARFAPIACAGPLLTNELNALQSALATPKKPLVAIVGGAKVSSKLEVLINLAERVDHLIVGGGIANTFIAAEGLNVGKSLYEPDLIEQAKLIMHKVPVPIPEDVIVAHECSPQATASTKPLAEVSDADMILDIGPKSTQTIHNLVQIAGTLVWNGPLGVFEIDAFGQGTAHLAQAIAQSTAFSVAGGGDTLAAVEKYGIDDKISYISTGGGAFLEYLEGKTLPALAVLQARTQTPEAVI